MDTLIPEYFEYRIKAGDSLSMIMAKFYGVGPRSPSYNKILNQILVPQSPYQRPKPDPNGVTAAVDGDSKCSANTSCCLQSLIQSGINTFCSPIRCHVPGGVWPRELCAQRYPRSG